MIYLIALIICSLAGSFDHETRCAMNHIYIIELERRSVAPESREFQNLALLKNYCIGRLSNAALQPFTPSAQNFIRDACETWSSETLQKYLLLENRLYIDEYRRLLTHMNNCHNAGHFD